MSVDMFLSFGKEIKGESKDPYHLEEIDVLEWNWGATNPTDYATGLTARGAVVRDVTLKKYVDRASPTLAQFLVNRQPIKTAILSVRKSAGSKGSRKPVDYLTITLTKVRINRIDFGSSDEELLKETIGLAYQSIQIEYKEQKDDGSPKPTIAYQYDRTDYA